MSEEMKLKEEIAFLKDINSQLKDEIKERNEKYYEIEAEYRRMKNEVYNATKIKLRNQEEYIKETVEKELESEKVKYKTLKSNYDDALEKINCLNRENNLLNEKLNIFEVEASHKKDVEEHYNEMANFVVSAAWNTNSDIVKNNINKTIQRNKILEKDYQKLVLEWNKLCDEMESVLSENRHLRKLANVPENYGIDLEKLKVGDRETVENLRGRIRVLQRELEEAEHDRAKARFKLINTNFSEVDNPGLKKYDRLTPEQKVKVEEYIYDLFTKDKTDIKDVYDLKKEITELKLKNEILEKQLFDFKFKLGQQVEALYEKKPSNPLNNISFKKIDLQERIKSFEYLDKPSVEEKELITLSNKQGEKIKLESKAMIPEKSFNNKDEFDKQSVHSNYSNDSTQLSVKQSISSNQGSFRSNSINGENRERLTIQEKLKFSSGRIIKK